MNGITNTLAERINNEHAACLAAASDALDHAMQAGELLAEAKATCAHGQWQNWLAENFRGSARTARMYMQLAERREELEAKRQRHTVLSIGEARRLIAEPADKEREGTECTATFDAIIDAMLNGPFCRRDFRAPCVSWLQTKIAHQSNLPALAALALTTEVETEVPFLRTVPESEIVDALRILLAHINGDGGFQYDGTTANDVSCVNIVMQRMAGSLIVELEHRQKLPSHKQYKLECSSALAQFSATVDARLAELEGAA